MYHIHAIFQEQFSRSHCKSSTNIFSYVLVGRFFNVEVEDVHRFRVFYFWKRPPLSDARGWHDGLRDRSTGKPAISHGLP